MAGGIYITDDIISEFKQLIGENRVILEEH